MLFSPSEHSLKKAENTFKRAKAGFLKIYPPTHKEKLSRQGCTQLIFSESLQEL